MSDSKITDVEFAVAIRRTRSIITDPWYFCVRDDFHERSDAVCLGHKQGHYGLVQCHPLARGACKWSTMGALCKAWRVSRPYMQDEEWIEVGKSYTFTYQSIQLIGQNKNIADARIRIWRTELMGHDFVLDLLDEALLTLE